MAGGATRARRVLVLGAGGMLGHKLCQRLSARPDYEVVATVRRDVADYRGHDGVFDGVALEAGVDVLDFASLEPTLRRLDPDVVLNCVGVVKQLDAAHDRWLSVGINSFLPHELARVCATIDAKLIHFSTDCVFSGEQGGYRENDVSDARDLYGQSKYLGETDASETSALTLRLSIIGRELSRPTHGLIEWFLSQAGGKVRGFDRAIYTGFTTLEIARIVTHVIERAPRIHGLYHVASASISKYDLLLLVRRIYGLDVQIDRDEDFACDRSLVMGPFAETTGYAAPSWERMIEEMHADPTSYPEPSAV